MRAASRFALPDALTRPLPSVLALAMTDIFSGYDRLQKAYALLRDYAETSAGGLASGLPPIPGLAVAGRRIALPADEAAMDFIVAHASPCVTSGEASLAGPLHSAYEVSPATVTFSNPDWAVALDELVRVVVTELLGTATRPVEAHLTKLLCLGPGARLSHAEAGAFATLIVQLPSICNGGALRVRHLGAHKTYDFGEASGRSEYACHYACLLAEADCEALPLSSGRRVALVYTLVWRDLDDAAPSARAASAAVAAFTAALQVWHASDSKPYAVFGLANRYTAEAIKGRGMAALSGRDKLLAQVLHHANTAVDAAPWVRLFIVGACKAEEFDYNGGECGDTSDDDNWERRDTDVEWSGGLWWSLKGDLVVSVASISIWKTPT